MASPGNSIHCWVKLLILVAGQAMLRVNPNPPKLPLISSFGNQICEFGHWDPCTYNAHNFRKFVVDNHLTTDDMCLTMARQISIMTTLKIKDKRPQISAKTLQAVRTSLANSKLKSTTFRTRYTKDDSDPLARRSVLLQCKQYTDNLSKAPRAPERYQGGWDTRDQK